jgi:predicted CXXCH cytochrome family protein
MNRLSTLRAAGTRFWTSVRPRSLRGGLVAAGLIAAGSAILSLVLVAMLWIGLALAAPYLEVTLHPERNAQALAGAELRYAGVGTCATCHEPEVSRLTTSKHAAIGCESCHGALGDHATSNPGPEAVALIETPTATLCVRCHARTEGRPAGFAEVVVADHYLDTCLACHNPHSGISRKPPVVVHPIADLPPCITCHGDDAFRRREIRHPVASQDDAACIACHELRPTGASVKP